MATRMTKITSRNGRQSIELPRDFQINDDKVYVKKMGKALYIIIPCHSAWKMMWEGTEQFIADFMGSGNQPDNQRLSILDQPEAPSRSGNEL